MPWGFSGKSFFLSKKLRVYVHRNAPIKKINHLKTRTPYQNLATHLYIETNRNMSPKKANRQTEALTPKKTPQKNNNPTGFHSVRLPPVAGPPKPSFEAKRWKHPGRCKYSEDLRVRCRVTVYVSWFSRQILYSFWALKRCGGETTRTLNQVDKIPPWPFGLKVQVSFESGLGYFVMLCM